MWVSSIAIIRFYVLLPFFDWSESYGGQTDSADDTDDEIRRCVRACVRDALAERSLIRYFSFQPVLHNWCNKGHGMCYPICRVVYIKEPSMLIGIPWSGSSKLSARVILYAQSHRQDSTYHSLCYTSCGALDGSRNSSMSPPWGIDPTTYRNKYWETDS